MKTVRSRPLAHRRVDRRDTRHRLHVRTRILRPRVAHSGLCAGDSRHRLASACRGLTGLEVLGRFQVRRNAVQCDVPILNAHVLAVERVCGLGPGACHCFRQAILAHGTRCACACATTPQPRRYRFRKR